MNNDDFYVLHLSDLHIKNESKGKTTHFYSNALKKLIDDIEIQIKNKQNIIIVISGDIVDQGKYDLHFNTVIKFFTDLYERIGNKVHDILIVPGNHDKHRNNINTLISMAHAKVGLDIDAIGSDIEWEKQLEAYAQFFTLTEQIYDLFGKKNIPTNTFGVDIVNVNDYNICFLRMDSAWCSHSVNDYRTLRISEYQLKSLCNEYKEIRNKCDSENMPIQLTVAIMHHPLNWLIVEEEELCNSYFLSNDFLDVDVLMCGHVHNFSVVNYFNHEHSLLTLVTGIGWGTDEPSPNKEHHRYSIYALNLFHNSCDIIMRKTKNNNDFDFDYSVYAGAHEIKDNKLRYPLKVKESNAFIRINAPEPIETKSLFFDNDLLNILPEVSRAIASFSDSIARLYDQYIDNFFDGLIKEFMPDYYDNSANEEQVAKYEDVLQQISDYFTDEKNLPVEFIEKWFRVKNTFYDFSSFLTEICLSAVEELKGCYSDNIKIRTHFRWHDNLNNCDLYPMLCQYSNLPEDEKSESMQSLSWGGLIEPAFNTGEPIIFSANKQYNAITTTWDDFITIVPQFNNYTYDIRIKKSSGPFRKGINESRPMLTFGISVKGLANKKDILTLYLLSYLKFDRILAQVIDEFVRLFYIDVKNFLPHIQSIKNNAYQEDHTNV